MRAIETPHGLKTKYEILSGQYQKEIEAKKPKKVSLGKPSLPKSKDHPEQLSLF